VELLQRTCDNFLLSFKGAQGAPGRGWPPYMQKRRTPQTLTVDWRSIRPYLAGRQGDRDAPGAGCLPSAPSGHVGAVAQLKPPAADHTGRRAATSAVVRGL